MRRQSVAATALWIGPLYLLILVENQSGVALRLATALQIPGLGWMQGALESGNRVAQEIDEVP